MVKRIALLGSTGSIGQQTLDVVADHPENFEIVSLAAGGRGEILAEQIMRFKPRHICLADESAIVALRARLEASIPDYKPTFHYGAQGLLDLSSDPEADVIVVATSGQHGFAPTLTALKSGKEVALA